MALFKKRISFKDASGTLGVAAHNMMYPENARNFLASFDPTKDKLQLVYSMIGSLIAAEGYYINKKFDNFDINGFAKEACEIASLMNGNKPECAVIEFTCNNNIETMMDKSLNEHDAISMITDNYINQNGLQNISQSYANNLFNNIAQIKTFVIKFFDTYKISG